MKKVIILFLAMLLAVALAIPMASVAAHTEVEPFTTDLIAGQNIDVGSVSVWNDGTYLYVTYEITDPDWRITETHLYVGKTEPNTATPPLTTAPGQFPYDDDDAASISDTVVAYEILLADIDSYHMQLNKKGKPTGVMVADSTPGVTPCNNVYIAAHAVVDTYPLCQSQGIVYGTERGGNNNTSPVGGTIYQIDVIGGTETSLFVTGLDPAERNYPNGNAFDPVTNRLYYSIMDSNELWFYDFAGTQTLAGPLSGLSAGGSFYQGKYYYFVDQSDDLRVVSFNPDGTIASDDPRLTDITGNTKSWGFGDLVITPEGILYGSPGGEFFKIDLSTDTYTSISTTGAVGLQLAIGSDGVLYGHSAGTGDFYVVDPLDGSITGPIQTLNQYTDLASGELCIPDEETAWGDGEDFDHPNWAMYFEYHIQYPPIIERYPEEGTVYIGYEDWGNGDFDYNDFGMYFSAEETYEWITDDYYLTGVTMTFEAQIYDSGMDHLIHITRPISGASTVTVSRGIAAYGGETAAGTYNPTGNVDVVLFDTSKYTWPSKQIGEIVTVEIEVDDPSSNPMVPLNAPRWDVDPFMANYDPWEIGSLYGSLFHLADMQSVTAVTSGAHPELLDHDLVGLTLPYILVVPSDAWIPPYEDSCISGPRLLPSNGLYPDGPYAYFYDYYSTSGTSHPTWYDEITDSFVGLGGLSW